MKKIIRLLILMIVVGFIGFVYYRWGYKTPETLSINEKFVVGGCEFVIEEANVVPAGLVRPYFGYSPKLDTVGAGKTLDLTITVKNISDIDIVLLDEMIFSIDQINDPVILKFLHLHFSEKSETVSLYNQQAPYENLDFDNRTKLKPNETKKLNFIFYCQELSNNVYLLEISDWSGNQLLYRQIEFEDMLPTQQIITNELNIEPISSYRQQKDYGISLHIKNNSKQRQPLSDMMLCVAIDDALWNYKVLEKCICNDKEYLISDFILEPHMDYTIHLIENDFNGNGEFYIQIDGQYFFLKY